MRRLITYVTLGLLMATACKSPVTNTEGPVNQVPTGNPETPYMLEGDYTPKVGVLYKVAINGDTCFVIVDSMTAETMYGTYYQVVEGSDCVEPKSFKQDIHWKEKRKEANVFLYQEPEYKPVDDNELQRPTYKVREQRDIEYGQALGYWTSLPNNSNEKYIDVIEKGLKHGVFRTTQSLRLDIYSPIDSTDSDGDKTRRPMLLLFHGGGFYVGDKNDTAICAWCRHLSSLGYVTVSANYRMGFMPTKKEIALTGYMALQDAHAAMRFLVHYADKYGIDTNNLFVGGCSAGSITALNLCFMTDEDSPMVDYARKMRKIGLIASSGNDFTNTFHIKAVVNMWGALPNLKLLKNRHTDIVSFHGDADKIVPYDNGYPFANIKENVGKRLFNRMYGSFQIDKRARELGYRSILYTYPGEGHGLQHNSDGSWNQKNWESIRNRMSSFLYTEVVGKKPTIEVDRDDNRHFYISDDNVSEVEWKVEGGFIMKIGVNNIWVVWRQDAEKQTISASGLTSTQYGFNIQKTIK